MALCQNGRVNDEKEQGQTPKGRPDFRINPKYGNKGARNNVALRGNPAVETSCKAIAVLEIGNNCLYANDIIAL